MNDGLGCADLTALVLVSALLGALDGTTLTIMLFLIFQDWIANRLLESLLF